MSAARPYPWAALVDALGDARLAEIEAALAAAKTDPFDRDAFVLDGAVGRVLRELVPPDAPADAVTAYAALLQALVLHRSRGRPVLAADRERLRELLTEPAPPGLAAGRTAAEPAGPAPAIRYVQLPERMVWAEPAPGALAPGPGEEPVAATIVPEPGPLRTGAAHEPLDGVFLTTWSGGVRVLAVLGFRPERDGFTTIEASARPVPLPAPPPRPDGRRPFATVLPAGERMGFFSVTSQAELIWLALLAAAAAAG